MTSDTPKRPKRAHGDGLLSHHARKDGRWPAALVLPDGRRKWVYGHTQKEARKKLNDLRREVERGLAPAAEHTTVAQHLADWLDAATPGLKPSTAIRYGELIRLHLVPDLGNVRLSKLQPQTVARLYAAKLAAGLSPRTVKQIHATLHVALEQAVRWELLPRNVADLARPPRAEKHQPKTLSLEQAGVLLSEYRRDRYGALYVLALTTSLRSGELRGLRWADVDLDTATLIVRQSARRMAGTIQMGDPKSRRSGRPAALPVQAVAALRWHAAQQYAERSLAGVRWDDRGLVFANEIGRPLELGNLQQRHYYPLLAELGLPRVKLHELRHTYGTLLTRAGVPLKTVSEAMGHSGIAITADVYAHESAAHVQAAADAMSRLFERIVVAVVAKPENAPAQEQPERNLQA